VLLGVPRGVVGVEKFLRADVICCQGGVVGDVQLTAQHAVLHHAQRVPVVREDPRHST